MKSRTADEGIFYATKPRPPRLSDQWWRWRSWSRGRVRGRGEIIAIGRVVVGVGLLGHTHACTHSRVGRNGGGHRLLLYWQIVVVGVMLRGSVATRGRKWWSAGWAIGTAAKTLVPWPSKKKKKIEFSPNVVVISQFHLAYPYVFRGFIGEPSLSDPRQYLKGKNWL